MLSDEELVGALRRHWEHSGKDEDAAHEIYHDDAVLEFPQSGERFEASRTFGSGVAGTPPTSRSTCVGSRTATTSWSPST